MNKTFKIVDVEITLMTNYSTRIFSHSYLGDKESKTIFTIGKEGEIKKDEIKSIFQSLQKNPLMSLLDISRETDLSYDQIRYNLSKYKKSLSNTLLLKPKNVQRELVLLKTSNKKFIDNYAKLHRNITEINYTVGEYDSYIIVEALNNVRHITKTIIYELKDSLDAFSILDLSQIYKYGWYGL